MKDSVVELKKFHKTFLLGFPQMLTFDIIFFFNLFGLSCKPYFTQDFTIEFSFCSYSYLFYLFIFIFSFYFSANL